MQKKFNVIIIGAIIIGAAMGLGGTVLALKSAPEPTMRKIVVFKPGVLTEAAKENLVKKFNGIKIKDLSLIDGKAALLSLKAAADLANQPGVLRIDDDIEVFALAKPVEIRAVPKIQQGQNLPWGIDRIDAELVWQSGNTADPVKVAIIDTGIYLTHPDLKDNIKGGVNTINSWKSANDDNGHGTHVAGIAAAIDNTFGVVGAGPKIDLYAVKALDRNGSGYLSDIIEGLNWAIKNKMQVVNMSLGATVDVQSFREAIQRVNDAGIIQVAAAGNDGKAVNYPAAYPQVIAVSATDSANKLASWSSRGPEVDLSAPGVNIYSTYLGSIYRTFSGTSMATPHVAGAAALVVNTPVEIYDANGNGIWDPSEVQRKLQDRAIDLGASGSDNLYGWGLVNAYKAVQP